MNWLSIHFNSPYAFAVEGQDNGEIAVFNIITFLCPVSSQRLRGFLSPFQQIEKEAFWGTFKVKDKETIGESLRSVPEAKESGKERI